LPLCELSERFAGRCRERGIAAEHVQGTSSDRPDVIRRLQTGETTLVSNAMLLTEGFDAPSIACIVPLRPTRIRSLFAQQVGRGTRIDPGKDHLLVRDFLWMSHRHDVVRPAALVAASEEEAAQIHGDGDLIENVDQARADRLTKLARELEPMKANKAHEFDCSSLRSRSAKRSSPISNRSRAGIRTPSRRVNASA
jgi:superfamily II DNA or RNA helicase